MAHVDRLTLAVACTLPPDPPFYPAAADQHSSDDGSDTRSTRCASSCCSRRRGSWQTFIPSLHILEERVSQGIRNGFATISSRNAAPPAASFHLNDATEPLFLLPSSSFSPPHLSFAPRECERGTSQWKGFKIPYSRGRESRGSAGNNSTASTMTAEAGVQQDSMSWKGGSRRRSVLSATAAHERSQRLSWDQIAPSVRLPHLCYVTRLVTQSHGRQVDVQEESRTSRRCMKGNGVHIIMSSTCTCARTTRESELHLLNPSARDPSICLLSLFLSSHSCSHSRLQRAPCYHTGFRDDCCVARVYTRE